MSALEARGPEDNDAALAQVMTVSNFP